MGVGWVRLLRFVAGGDAGVDDEPGANGDGGGNLGQHLHRAAAVVELASAMIGHVDPLDAVIDRDLGVLRGSDPLDDQWYLVLVLDQLDGAPVERHLEFASGDPAAANGDMTLGEIALAPAVI